MQNRDSPSRARVDLPAADGESSHASRLAIVGELTASIAHEISQPLSAILSNADTADIYLEDSNPPVDELRKILRDIRRDALRASDVIRNVRSLARKRDPDLVKLEANGLAHSVVDLLEQEKRRRGMCIHVVPLDRPAYVRGDQALLVQVLINLVMNAMDSLEASGGQPGACMDQPPIELHVGESPHGEIELKVVDQGCGIPEEQLGQLFDSFYTSKAHGLGLGLSISRSIISMHGGRILANNNAGAGVTFHVFLPPYSER